MTKSEARRSYKLCSYKKKRVYIFSSVLLRYREFQIFYRKIERPNTKLLRPCGTLTQGFYLFGGGEDGGGREGGVERVK